VTNPNASQARKAEEEMPTRRATSLMRKNRFPPGKPAALDEFFLLDTTANFL
jgi:hypothetical protein